MQIAPILTVLLDVFARRVTPVMAIHVAVRLTNLIGGQTGNNFSQTCEELTKERNKIKQQLIDEWMAKQIVVKYLQGEIFFATSFTSF